MLVSFLHQNVAGMLINFHTLYQNQHLWPNLLHGDVRNTILLLTGCPFHTKNKFFCLEISVLFIFCTEAETVCVYTLLSGGNQLRTVDNVSRWFSSSRLLSAVLAAVTELKVALEGRHCNLCLLYTGALVAVW